MAELVYDKTGRLLFTKEMKKEYTILMPQMLPIHFGMFQKMLQLEGYNVVQLNNEGQAVDSYEIIFHPFFQINNLLTMRDLDRCGRRDPPTGSRQHHPGVFQLCCKFSLS